MEDAKKEKGKCSDSIKDILYSVESMNPRYFMFSYT